MDATLLLKIDVALNMVKNMREPRGIAFRCNTQFTRRDKLLVQRGLASHNVLNGYSQLRQLWGDSYEINAVYNTHYNHVYAVVNLRLILTCEWRYLLWKCLLA